MKVLSYKEPLNADWDLFVNSAYNATFQHTRRFLSYHGERFNDQSLLIFDDGDRLIGVFSAAINPRNSAEIVSHPGATFGGVIHNGRLRGEMMLEAVRDVIVHYKKQGFLSLRYKAVPYIYHAAPAQDDLYALFRLGAARYRCDLSCTIDLFYRLPVSDRRRRSMRKAISNGVKIESGYDHAASLWPVLEENLLRKYDATPTHSIEEITLLAKLFPENIWFVVAKLHTEVVAGVVLFITPSVFHAQYIATSETGSGVCALDGIFEHCIELARKAGARYFDFGISNERDGRYLNTGLYQFKSEFGGGGMVHEFYVLDLMRGDL